MLHLSKLAAVKNNLETEKSRLRKGEQRMTLLEDPVEQSEDIINGPEVEKSTIQDERDTAEAEICLLSNW